MLSAIIFMFYVWEYYGYGQMPHYLEFLSYNNCIFAKSNIHPLTLRPDLRQPLFAWVHGRKRQKIHPSSPVYTHNLYPSFRSNRLSEISSFQTSDICFAYKSELITNQDRTTLRMYLFTLLDHQQLLLASFLWLLFLSFFFSHPCTQCSKGVDEKGGRYRQGHGQQALLWDYLMAWYIHSWI